MLPAVVSFDLAAPVVRRRLAGLVDHDTIVRHRLGEVVRQVLTVVELEIARPRVERQVAAMVDDEVERVEVPVLAENSTTREQAIRVVHADLPTA